MPGTMLSVLDTLHIFFFFFSFIIMFSFFRKKPEIKYGKMLKFDNIELWEVQISGFPFFWYF